MSPWRTDARVALQAEARAFARDVVMPLADALDPQKAANLVLGHEPLQPAIPALPIDPVGPSVQPMTLVA